MCILLHVIFPYIAAAKGVFDLACLQSQRLISITSIYQRLSIRIVAFLKFTRFNKWSMNAAAILVGFRMSTLRLDVFIG